MTGFLSNAGVIGLAILGWLIIVGALTMILTHYGARAWNRKQSHQDRRGRGADTR